jgi:dihydropteroate synthase
VPAHACYRPMLLGVSRKRFLGRLIGEDQASRRDAATATACAAAVATAGVEIVRVHNVGVVREAVTVADAIRRHARS